MYRTFFEKQKINLIQAFQIYSETKSRNIHHLPPEECLKELSTVPRCGEYLRDLLAAQELGAIQPIEEIFAAIDKPDTIRRKL